METNTEEYKEHLEKKYLPGRDKYLSWFFFPKLLRNFRQGEIVDLGFGTGEFLKYLKLKNRACRGIDSNPFLTELLADQGFDVPENHTPNGKGVTEILDTVQSIAKVDAEQRERVKNKPEYQRYYDRDREAQIILAKVFEPTD